jgi:altronate dehydratase small subunit
VESNDFLRLDGKKVALVLDARDNVGVVLADLSRGESCIIRGRGAEYALPVLEDIAFGHKVALGPLKQGEAIRKYGEEIGVARVDIAPGGWIHTHNLYCERGM